MSSKIAFIFRQHLRKDGLSNLLKTFQTRLSESRICISLGVEAAEIIDSLFREDILESVIPSFLIVFSVCYSAQE